MKLPKICQKCNREPKVIIGKDVGWSDYLRCLDRVVYSGEPQFPKTHCYYFKAREEKENENRN